MRPPSLAEQAADQIRNRIVKGDFRLGEALSETTLATELGISKTPVEPLTKYAVGRVSREFANNSRLSVMMTNTLRSLPPTGKSYSRTAGG